MENEELKKENISERKLFVSIFLIIILAIDAFLILVKESATRSLIIVYFLTSLLF
jgi:hypothetical protein